MHILQSIGDIRALISTSCMCVFLMLAAGDVPECWGDLESVAVPND